MLLDGFEPAARRDILARLRAGGRSIHARAGHA
jgi:hypothetical protein